MKVLAIDPGYDRLGVAIMEYLNGVPNPAGFFNNKKLKLSRQHGLIQLFDFINFPDYPELYAMNDSLFLTAKVVFFI